MSIGDIDLILALGGLFAGLLVGLTGMGGAVIVTPMLVLLFGVPPAAAISSDVVAAAAMKPVGAWVHIRAATVHWKLVGWISAGSIPGVLIGTWAFSRVLSTSGAEDILRTLIGVVVLIALAAMLAKNWWHVGPPAPGASSTSSRAPIWRCGRSRPPWWVRSSVWSSA